MDRGHCLCQLLCPGHIADTAKNSSALNANIVFFFRNPPYWHEWKTEYMARCATSVQKVVAQDKLNWGFSTTKITPNSTAHLTNFGCSNWCSWSLWFDIPALCWCNHYVPMIVVIEPPGNQTLRAGKSTIVTYLHVKKPEGNHMPMIIIIFSGKLT